MIEEDKKPDLGTEINEFGDEVIVTGPPRLWLTTEREAPEYLTRDDIFELGFLRSNPERKVWQHKDKPTLFLEQIYHKVYAIKDHVVEETQVLSKVFYPNRTDDIIQILYMSTKPNKEDIQLVINSYAG